MTRRARRAIAAIVERANHDALTSGKALDILAYRFDNARHLVSDHARRADAMVHVSVIDVKVGAAQADIADADRDFTGLRLEALALGEFESALFNIDSTFEWHDTYPILCGLRRWVLKETPDPGVLGAAVLPFVTVVGLVV
nr:hypothetical protein GCM10017606_23190 [Microbacterium terregens]